MSTDTRVIIISIVIIKCIAFIDRFFFPLIHNNMQIDHFALNQENMDNQGKHTAKYNAKIISVKFEFCYIYQFKTSVNRKKIRVIKF